MSGLQDQPAILRWALRIGWHAVDGYAAIGSILTAILGLVWIAQNVLGASLPGNFDRATTEFIGRTSGTAAVVLLIALGMQAAARAGMDEQRIGSQLDPAHIRDLQRQAGTMSQVISTPQYFLAVDVSSVAARNLFQHFPQIAASIRDWNHGIADYWTANQGVRNRVDPEAKKRIANVELSVYNLMMSIAMGGYSSPTELIWRIDRPQPETQILTFFDPKSQQDIAVGAIPEGVAPEEFQSKVIERLIAVRESAEAVRFREIVKQLDALRSAIKPELEGVQLDHVLGGRCDTCRPRNGKR